MLGPAVLLFISGQGMTSHQRGFCWRTPVCCRELQYIAKSIAGLAYIICAPCQVWYKAWRASSSHFLRSSLTALLFCTCLFIGNTYWWLSEASSIGARVMLRFGNKEQNKKPETFTCFFYSEIRSVLKFHKSSGVFCFFFPPKHGGKVTYNAKEACLTGSHKLFIIFY